MFTDVSKNTSVSAGKNVSTSSNSNACGQASSYGASSLNCKSSFHIYQLPSLAIKVERVVLNFRYFTS